MSSSVTHNAPRHASNVLGTNQSTTVPAFRSTLTMMLTLTLILRMAQGYVHTWSWQMPAVVSCHSIMLTPADSAASASPPRMPRCAL